MARQSFSKEESNVATEQIATEETTKTSKVVENTNGLFKVELQRIGNYDPATGKKRDKPFCQYMDVYEYNQLRENAAAIGYEFTLLEAPKGFKE
jgi:hypothetical protein